MTPCVLKDGDTCYAMSIADTPICVGCGRSPEALGRLRPVDWAKTVAEYYRNITPAGMVRAQTRAEKAEAALKFIQDLAEEELSYAKVGTGAEVALRHIARRARETLAK